MTTKIKTALLAAFFFFGLLTGLQAQDKYDFATISLAINQQTTSTFIGVSTKDTYQEFECKQTKVTDFKPLLEKVEEYTDKGWEVYNSSYTPQFGVKFQLLTYFLRKKKN